SDGERNFSARDPRTGNCFLLCRWHRNWRHSRPIAIRSAHRHRFACKRVLGLPVWIRTHDFRRRSRMALGHRCRAKAVGRSRAAAAILWSLVARLFRAFRKKALHPLRREDTPPATLELQPFLALPVL